MAPLENRPASTERTCALTGVRSFVSGSGMSCACAHASPGSSSHALISYPVHVARPNTGCPTSCRAFFAQSVASATKGVCSHVRCDGEPSGSIPYPVRTTSSSHSANCPRSSTLIPSSSTKLVIGLLIGLRPRLTVTAAGAPFIHAL